jgi:hypothetical protein
MKSASLGLQFEGDFNNEHLNARLQMGFLGHHSGILTRSIVTHMVTSKTVKSAFIYATLTKAEIFVASGAT